jgi:hypothetical protein
VYNSARLQLARAAFERGAPSRTFAVLEPLGPEERFAAEYQAWFHLWQGDAGAAKERLAGLVARGEHRTGRSLCNFLHGVTLILEEREEEAARVFRQLPGIPWPRTWTLGSHYAAGRLGDGDLGAYLAGAFPFEKKNLRAHAELLARARKLPPCAIPLALRDPGDLEAARPQEGPAPRRTGEPGPRS